MRRFVPLMMLGLACAVAASVTAQGSGLPLWAYGWSAPPAPPGTPATPPAAPAPQDPNPKSLPGSTAGPFTRAQVYNRFGPADWFPNDHPPMPDIVAKGRQDQNIFACSLCHRQHGKGNPENAPVADLPV